MASTPVGEAVVKIVPDVSGMEPAIRAELDRISAAIRVGETAVDDLRRALHDAWHDNGGDMQAVAAALLQEFVIIRRKERKEPDADAS